MYARVVTNPGNPDAVNKADEFLDIVRNSVLPAAKSQTGFKGYLLLGDRTTGKTIGITLWETEADRDATGPDSEYYRKNMGQLASVSTAAAPAAIVENREVLVRE